MAEKVGEAFVEIRADLTKLKADMAAMKGTVTKTTTSMADKFKAAGRVMTIAGAAITAAFGYAVKGSIDLEAKLKRVEIQSGATAKQMTEIKKVALSAEMVKLGKSGSEVAEVFNRLASEGYNIVAMKKMLNPIIETAIVLGTEEGETTKLMLNLMQQYNLEAKDMAYISDVLAGALANTSFQGNELVETMKYAGVAASQLGWSLEGTIPIIDAVIKVTGEASMAGTQFRMMVTKLRDPTAEMADQFKNVGITLDEVARAIKTPIGLIELLNKAHEKGANFASMFGARAASAAAVIARQSVPAVEALTEKVSEQGFAQKAVGEIMDTTTGKFAAFGAALQNIRTTIGDALLPTLTELATKATEIAIKFKEWAEANKPLVDIIVKFAAGVGALMLVLGPLFMMLPGIVLAFTGLKTALIAIPVLAGKAAIGISTLGGAFALAGANIIIWLEVYKEWKDLTEMMKNSTTDVNAALTIQAKQLEINARKLGLSTEEFKHYLETGERATKAVNWDAYNKGLAELNKLAVEGKISGQELYKAMRELAIETGVATEEIAELDSEMGTIVITTEALKSEMELLTKEYEAYGKSVEDSVKYYKDMVDKLNEVEVVLKTELLLLEEGTEAYNEKIAEIYDNAKAINEMQKALDELIKPLEGLELINAKLVLIGDTVVEIPSKLKLLKEAAILLKKAWDDAIPETKAWYEAEKAYKANQDAIEELTKSFDKFGEKGTKLIEKLISLKERQKELQDAIDTIGVDKADKEYQKLKISLNEVELQIGQTVDALNNLETEQKEAEEAAKNLADAQKEIADSIYELTHTDMENAIHKLDQQRQAYLDVGIAIEDVNKWYDLQIAKLKELNPELDNTTKKLNDFTVVMAEQLNEAFGDAAKQIDFATASLNNFTEAGVAAAIATIKMSFLPALNDIQNSMAATKRMFDAGQLGLVSYANLMKVYQGQIDMVTGQMQEQIDIVLYGYQEYQNILSGMSGGTASAADSISTSWGKVKDAVNDAVDDVKDTVASATGWLNPLNINVGGPNVTGGTGPAGAILAAQELLEQQAQEQAAANAVAGGWGSYQHGTPYVPRTGLYQLHQGESVTPASQSFTYSPSFKMTVQGGGDAQNIAYEVKKVLDDSAKQFKRVPYESVPGRA